MRKLAIVAASLVMLPALSQAKTLEDLLVEKGVITRGEASGASMGGGSKVYWNGGTRLEFPDNGFTTQINTQIQSRYTFTDNDEDTGAQNRSSFDMVRARLALSGTALNNEFSYMLQTDFVGDGSLQTGEEDQGKRSPNLKDAWLQWHACDWVSVRMGQFKTAISRQYNSSSAKLQFADRSVASETFDLGRQNGVGGKWMFMDDKLALTAAMFNGQSEGEGSNRGGVDTKQTGVASVRWDVMGKMDAYEEGDVNYTEDMAVNIGGAFAAGQANLDPADSGLTSDADVYNISFDANMKYKGLSVQGEFYWAETSYDDESDLEDSEPLGFYVESGYFLTPKKWEVAARFAMVDCDDGKASNYNSDCSGMDQVNEATVGINYYWWKNNLKAQVNYVILNQEALDDGDDINTNRWLLQLSSYF